jgi:hypothetical protein
VCLVSEGSRAGGSRVGIRRGIIVAAMALPPDSTDTPAEGLPDPAGATVGADAANPADAPIEPGQPPLSTSTPGPPTREYRAQWTFILATVFLSFAYVLILARAGGSVGGGLLLAGALGIAVNGAGAWGLANRRDWARSAMTPILWIYVGAGLLVFVLVLARGGLNIPIGAVLAAWALLARPSEALGPVPGSSTGGTVLILGAVAAALVQFL